MSWSEITDELGTDADLNHLDAAQTEAVISLLTLMLYADQKATVLERSELESQLATLPWMAAKGEMLYQAAGRAAAAAQEAGDEAAFRAIAQPAADRLPEGATREKIYRMAVALAHSDLNLDPREVVALGWLADALGLDAAQAKAILDAAS